MSLAGKLFRGASLSLMDNLVKTGALFFTTPLMVNRLGQEGYGQWLLCMSLLGYLTMVDLGLSAAVCRFLSSAIGAKDELRQAAIIDISQRYFRLMGWTVVTGSFAAALLAVVILGVKEEPWRIALAALIPGLTLAARFRFRMAGLLMRAHVRYDLFSLCSIMRVAAQSLCLWLVMHHGGGVLSVGLIQGSFDLVELCLQHLLARRAGLRRVEATLMNDTTAVARLRKDLLSFTRDTMLATIGDTLRYQAGPTVLGSVGNTRDISLYSTALRLTGTYTEIANSIFGGGVSMAFGHLQGAGDHTRLMTEFHRLTRLTAGFSAWAMGGIVIFAQPFLRRWLGPSFDESYSLVLILALPYALLAMQFPAYAILPIMGHQRPLMWISFFNGVLTVIATVLLGAAWGVHGVTWALAGEILLSVGLIVPCLLWHALRLNPAYYLARDVLSSGVLSLIAPLAAAWWLRDWLVPDYGSLFVAGCGYTLAFALTAPWLLFDAEGRQKLKRLTGF